MLTITLIYTTLPAYSLPRAAHMVPLAQEATPTAALLVFASTSLPVMHLERLLTKRLGDARKVLVTTLVSHQERAVGQRACPVQSSSQQTTKPRALVSG